MFQASKPSRFNNAYNVFLSRKFLKLIISTYYPTFYSAPNIVTVIKPK